MDHTTLITILLIAACLGLVVYNFLHKKHIHYNADELKRLWVAFLTTATAIPCLRKSFWRV